MNSILDDIKKMLGIDSGYDAFDVDIITNINTAIMSLTQFGIGPSVGFRVTGSTENWDALLTNDTFVEGAKTFVYLKVKLAFDPPTSSFAVEAIKEQILELSWRLMVQVDPIEPVVDPEAEL